MENKRKQQKIIYEDDHVKLTQSNVYIKKFYLPQTEIYQVLYENIQKVTLKQMDPMDQILGADEQYFIDFNKKKKQRANQYIQLAIQDKQQVLSFTASNPSTVSNIITQKISKKTVIQNNQSLFIQKNKQNNLKDKQQDNLYKDITINTQMIQNALNQLKNFQNNIHTQNLNDNSHQQRQKQSDKNIKNSLISQEEQFSEEQDKQDNQQ